MKKKILTLAMLSMLFMVFVSCDILSTINAVRGFYQEYQEFSQVYNDATQYTVLTETTLEISDTNIESMVPMDPRVYFMFDQNSEFLYVEQNLEGVPQKSLFHDSGDLYIEYMIDDNDVVTPRFPTAEQRFDGNTNANFLNENFSYEDVQNENKTGDRTYEMDVVLTQAINLDALGDFLNELKVFDESLAVLDDVVAHLTITFDSVDSTIDVRAEVQDYTITFEDQSTVTFSLNNHTVVKSPENFEMPNVFEDPYQMVAVDDILLATKVYEAEDAINYPGTANAGGWVQLDLGIGDYSLVYGNEAEYMVSLYDAEQNELALVDGEFSVAVAATFYLYITPAADGAVDITVHQVGGPVETTTVAETTTMVETTTEVETTTAAETTTENPE